MIKRAGKNGKSPSVLNHELNLRKYESSTKYKAEEPWVYPQSKQCDPVGLDNTSFGYAHNLSHSLSKKRPLNTAAGNRTKTPSSTSYLTADPGTRFSTKYRIKNQNELNLLRKTNTNIPTLAFMSNLRVSTSDNQPQMNTSLKLRN